MNIPDGLPPQRMPWCGAATTRLGMPLISVQRVVVVEAVREESLALLAGRMGQVVVGDPREEATRVSALVDERSTGRVLEWVEQAEAAGARLVAGGKRVGGVIEPTVLLDVPDGVAAWDEEIFAAIRPATKS